MEHSQSGSEALVKLLAIIGFFAVLGFILWVVVQGVRYFPSAFTSLASIAETVGGYRPQSELTIDLEKSIVNSGETFTLHWTDMGKGSYTFSYSCTADVILSVRASDSTLREVPCEDTLTLTEDVHGLFVSISAQKQRFSDVDFTVTFDATKGDTHVADGRVTIVNATVPTQFESEIVKNTITPTNTHTAVLPTAPKEALIPTPHVPQTAASVVSILPKSHADGFVDLRAMYLGVGTLESGSFTPKATFNTTDTAAFKFEVKNIGTKTSGAWSYELMLPGNVTYTSESQAGLAPNEKALFTIGFELSDDAKTSVKIGGEVTAADDTRNDNNTFDWSVKVSE